MRYNGESPFKERRVGVSEDRLSVNLERRHSEILPVQSSPQ